MRLSIIIIEYHCMQHVTECIESVNKYLNDIEKECIVVSNSQHPKQELDSHRERLAGATIVDTQNNLGYAGGVNTGIEHATGDYIYVLNPDCLLTDSNIIQIMDEMDQDEQWAITGPKVIDQSGVVQPSCRGFPKPWTFLLVRTFLSALPGATKEKERYMMNDFDRETTREVDWVSGGAMLVKSSSIKQFGGMDERYFLYMEDVDWCRSCWDNGYKVVYKPQSIVTHAGQHRSVHGSIFSRTTLTHTYLHLSSMIKFFVKNGHN